MAKKKSSSKIWWILGGLVVLTFGGLFAAKQAGLIGKEELTQVEFGKVKKADITERVSASGKVQPEVEVKLSSEVSGEIVGLYVTEGDSVVAGQLLIRIRPDNYESLLARAEAQVNSSKASLEQTKAVQSQSESRLLKSKIDFDRNNKLHEDKVISDAEFDQFNSQYLVSKQDVESAKANVQAASFNVKSTEAALKEARVNLNKTTITAPQSGTISKLNVELGERVLGTSQMTGTELLRIANLNKMEVRVNVNENDITRVSMNDTVIIDVDSYSSTGRKFKGLVYEIASSANGLSSSSAASISTDAVTEFEVKIRVLRSSYLDLLKGKRSYPLKPGMTASVEVITDRRNGVISVPLAAVTTRDPNAPKEDEKKDGQEDNKTDEKKVNNKKDKIKEVVFVNEKGKAKMREVKTGISDFDNIEIISGLKEGEEVISGPYLTVSKNLKDGEAIKKKEISKDIKK